MGKSREQLWLRLEQLLAKAREGVQQLTDKELEEFGKIYRAASTHLALQRGFGTSSRRLEELNHLVSRAHAVLYGRSPSGTGRKLLFWSLLAFPATVRRSAAYHWVAFAILLAGAVYGYVGASRDWSWTLEFSYSVGDNRTPYASREELRESLLTGREEAKGPGRQSVSGGSKTFFAAYLWTHNTKVALACFFLGFLAGIPTMLLLFYNGALLGVYTFSFHLHGLAYEWWAWVLPHGITEIFAIVLLAGGGLWIGRVAVAPGECSRGEAFREIRPDVIRLLLFAFPMLLFAGLVESFLRQSNLSETGRYLFAFGTAAFWIVYIGLVRPSAKRIQEIESQRTLAERKVSLPSDEDLLGSAFYSRPLNRSLR